MDKERAIEVAKQAKELLMHINEQSILGMAQVMHMDHDEEMLFCALFMGGMGKVVDCSVHSTFLRIGEVHGPAEAARFQKLLQAARDNTEMGRVRFTDEGVVVDKVRLEEDPRAKGPRAPAQPSPN